MTFKKRATLSILPIAAMLLFGFSLHASDNQVSLSYKYTDAPELDAVRYLDEAWSGVLLTLLYEGPDILPLDFDAGVLPPPVNSSEQVKLELQHMFHLKKYRTEDNISRIKFENDRPPLQAFIEEGLFDAQAYPASASLLKIIDHEIIYFTLREKMRIKRARPTQLVHDIAPIISVPKHAAYPSGHATQSFAIALILGRLDPQNKDVYEAFARDIALRREIAGVHYESDSKSGRLLARKVVAALLEYEEINELAEAAKKEYFAQ